MGCFIVCLGFSKKRKRRIRPSNKLISGDQIYGSYRHLDSQDVTLAESAVLESDCSNHNEAKVNSGIKIKKKVTFNLNVKIYEPIPDQDSYSSDKEIGEEIDAKKDKESNNINVKRASIEENKVGYRERGQYECSVLNPVENLTQWREVKEKSKKHPLLKKILTKENLGIMVEKQEEEMIKSSLNFSPKCKLMQDIAIDASLSHWVLTSQQC
ncbi:uncharacterized protein LOC124924990 [Impatiens glandulifera]|uniref:uncharacterized protein LOC124924990 n=1 Tax=Impatiens glandulifera TaxID=253017 RepID=UPI001FB0991A|nr:uncharacterized protein LOC124924990 [Impatiens glandulifera]